MGLEVDQLALTGASLDRVVGDARCITTTAFVQCAAD